MLSDTALKQTPLHSEHLKLKAKTVPFGGWDMPLQYEGIIAEYWNTRRSVSVFDTSHMGEFFVQASVPASGLDGCVTQRLTDLAVGQCRYGALLNEAGGVMDDLIVYRLAQEEWMVVVNGATTDKDAAQFQKVIKARGGRFQNASSTLGKVDVQGPQSRELLAKFISGIEKLNYYTFARLTVLGTAAIVSRTGYTGELGYEIYFPWDRMPELWNKVISLGAKPAGLGSRDVLRLEMGYPLYGHELTEEISPLEGGLEKFIDWDKDFIGKDALRARQTSGTQRKLIAFKTLSRRCARSDFQIFSASREPVGTVTSGTFSPALECGIGLGLVKAGFDLKDSKIWVAQDADSPALIEAQIVSRPFYRNGSLRA